MRVDGRPVGEIDTSADAPEVAVRKEVLIPNRLGSGSHELNLTAMEREPLAPFGPGNTLVKQNSMAQLVVSGMDLWFDTNVKA